MTAWPSGGTVYAKMALCGAYVTTRRPSQCLRCVGPRCYCCLGTGVHTYETPWEVVYRPRKTQCLRGHSFTHSNTRTTKTGERICRKCDRQRHRRAA